MRNWNYLGHLSVRNRDCVKDDHCRLALKSIVDHFRKSFWMVLNSLEKKKKINVQGKNTAMLQINTSLLQNHSDTAEGNCLRKPENMLGSNKVI